MTQDGFAGAERIGATIDVLADTLLGADATHYPAASLTAFDRAAHPSADALFGLRLSPGGPGLLTVRGLGTVVEAGTTRSAADAAAAAEAPTAELFARYGAKDVYGLPLEAVSAEQVAVPVRPESAEAWMRPEFPAAVARFAAERPVAVPEELATGAGVEVRLVVPSVFHPLTVRGDRQARAGHLAEVAEELYSGARAPRRQDWSVLTGLLAQPSAAAGVVFAGVAALQLDGRRSRASLVVSLASHPRQISELSAELADSRPQAEVWTVLIPAGPTAVLVERRIAPVPPLLLPVGQPDNEPDVADNTLVSVLQAFLPLPDGVSVLTVQLGTAQPDDWELYAATFAEILASIQLGWDGTRAALPQFPAQQPVAQAPVAQPVTQQPVTQALAPQAPAPQAPLPPAVVPPAPAMPPTVPAPAPAVAAPAAQERPKGVRVNVPPADFNPFAPPAPAPAPAAAAPAADAPAPAPGKGVKVNVPPADFNPFAAPAPAPVLAAAPAPQPVAQAAAPAAADPFGTVTTQQVSDPFGTVTSAQPVAPARVAAPTPPPAAAPAAAAPAPGKGVRVNVPPADFNPFAAPAPAATAAPEADAPAPGKGVKVNVPPPDFNPFAAPAPAPVFAPAPAAAPEPPANNPFG
ncbi:MULTISPECIES: hypothetical protein [unclassified Kitasatospora]|uniref:hypothetical protein n=1 Tax=unclassified Kitasatospora TaxID=2633591 RepID=UPI00070F02B0|nr:MULTISPECIES: hypothetical protein [unclassified Kitasatospora]KQV13345.1 hypothetical protein ASC99_09035 [Kitasatospora sp. Root107]KRB75207.1 hypothetical protein ASE03_14355 [Kitasatospora sp. Root187]